MADSTDLSTESVDYGKGRGRTWSAASTVFDIDASARDAKIEMMATDDIQAEGHTGAGQAASAGMPPSLAAGIAVLKKELKRLPHGPGVYRMIDRRGDVLYVGKAKSLKRRVTSYTHANKLPNRLRRMVSETVALEIISTHTEVEALLLEANLIKRLRPRYNVLMRDDKSFPYILITDESADEGPGAWARLMKYRGNRGKEGTYYGPFASAGAVNRTLNALQRAFLLRSCSDSVFASRTRPCLLYQIKRCSAPCVGRISEEDYAQLVEDAKEFLSGRNANLQRELANRMEAAAADLEYETAAYYRDRIQALSHVQAKQDINSDEVDDADIIAAHREGGHTCIQVFFFRGGRNYGNRAYYPRHDKQDSASEVLQAFIGQFYDNKQPPRLVLLSDALPEHELMAEALSSKAGRKVDVAVPKRGEKRHLVDHARRNAEAALARRLAESGSQRELLEAVADVLSLDGAPERIEVYDNSHVQGSNPVGAMIVAGPEGFVKNAYRKFNIKADIAPGDDYAMLREVLTRRFSRALKEDPDRERGSWPDLVLIDGGKGQLGVACGVLQELGIDDVPVVGIAKGPDRDAGREVFHFPDGSTKQLDPGDAVLYFLQRLRDEAHRFAIGAHRSRRASSGVRSLLDDVPGIGAKRKKALLHHFGSAREVSRAGLADLEAVDGINAAVAKKIYDYFHDEG